MMHHRIMFDTMKYYVVRWDTEQLICSKWDDNVMK
jgi:hypothetical protein